MVSIDSNYLVKRLGLSESVNAKDAESADLQIAGSMFWNDATGKADSGEPATSISSHPLDEHNPSQGISTHLSMDASAQTEGRRPQSLVKSLLGWS